MDRANPIPVMPDATVSSSLPSLHAEMPIPVAGVPSASFVIGRSASGEWLAVETHGFGGGIFRTCGHALSYAAFETGHRPQAVRLSEEVLALEM